MQPYVMYMKCIYLHTFQYLSAVINIAIHFDKQQLWHICANSLLDAVRLLQMENQHSPLIRSDCQSRVWKVHQVLS